MRGKNTNTLMAVMESSLMQLNSNPGCVEQLRNEYGITALQKRARLLTVGKHNDIEFTSADLNKIVAQFDSPVPIQLSHSTSVKDTVGFVTALWLENDGAELHGTMEFRDPAAIEKVKLGLWSKVSTGIYLKNPAMKLFEVSMTPFPADEKAVILNAAKAEIKKGSETMDKLDKKDEKAPVKKDDAVPPPADAPKAEAPPADAPNAEPAAMVKDDAAPVNGATVTMEKAQADAILNELATLRKEKAEADAARKKMEDEKHIDGLVKSGRIMPVLRDKELALYNSLDDEQRKAYNAVKETTPPIVEFGVKGSVEAKRPGGEPTQAELSQEVQGLLRNVPSYHEHTAMLSADPEIVAQVVARTLAQMHTA